MEAILDYYDPANTSKVSTTGFRWLDTSSIKKGEKVIRGDKRDIFIQFYKLNNSLRYCNGSYYRFRDSSLGDGYDEWLRSDDYKSISFDLYYGGGVVD
jgi:hypothetical protein